jgi:membrane peptidoglycan carboxypeptidase
MNNIINLIQQFQGFMQNPTQFLIQRNLGLSEEMLKNPDQAIQYLMNSGRITQEQYNMAVKQANQLKNNPQFQQYFNKK